MSLKNKEYAVLVCRVSTLGQDYDPQLDDLKNFAESKGYTDFHVIATKESGLVSHSNRIGTNDLFEWIEKNPDYKAVFCTEMSRLGRRLSSLVVIRDWFESKQIKFFLKDSNFFYDPEDSKSQFLFLLYGEFADSEMKAKQLRFSRAKKHYAAQGYAVSGKRLFGYERFNVDEKKKKYREHPLEAEIVRTIFNWYINGIENFVANPSIKQITLECFRRGYPTYTHSKRNVNKLLKEAAYTGFKTTNNKRKLPEHLVTSQNKGYAISSMDIRYPPLITETLFQEVQDKLKSKNLNADKSRKHTTILSKLIVCPECNKYYEGQYRSVDGLDKSFYRCTKAKYVFPCSNKQTISMSLIDSAVWSLIKTDLPMLAKEIKKINPDLISINLSFEKVELEKKKQQLKTKAELENKRIDILMRNSNIGIDNFDTYEKSINKISKEIQTIDERLVQIQQLLNLHRNNTASSLDKFITNNLDKIQKDRNQLRQYVQTFIKDLSLIYHDSNFSIIKVRFKRFSDPRITKYKTISMRSMINNNQEFSEIKDTLNKTLDSLNVPKNNNNQFVIRRDEELEETTFLLIDKRVTRQIQIFKSTFLIRVKGDIMEFAARKMKIKKLFELLKEGSTIVTLDKLIQPVFFTKLKFR